ncbi:MAG: hypothetical protein IPG10_14395 [Flavobacteriales bacterium]|nr:hypothetical protein [Flavobacteriales bacterium]
MKRTPPWKMVLGLMGVVVLLVGWTTATEPRGHHTRFEDLLFRSGDSDLVVMYSTYFATAGRCAGCHGHDQDTLASIDAQGRDVNVADDWRSSMMGNSARDPFFRAKMEHEVLVNPGHQGAIEGKCLSCHAPLGFHEERMLGHAPFTAAMLDTSTIGLDGVSCTSCHMQNPDSAGTLFSGELRFDSALVYGPYEDDEINQAIMEFFVGFRPGYGEHIQDGRVCAGCHTLITGTLDLQGNTTGDEFVEQATWHEWLNSVYTADPQTNCRGCHLPRITDSIRLAADYAFLQGHSPFGLHHLVGGNEFMLKLLKENRQALGIPATGVQFDSTIARTVDQLRHRTLDLDLVLTSRDPDTAYIEARLVNLAGHKFPSGYPSRRAFVQLVVTDAQNDTLFASGLLDTTYEVIGHDATYEAHYDMINDPGQAQIYELVMGDVNGDVTTVLERAKDPIKDNRLVPQGFSTTHYTYDTTRIAGVPASDIDFNHDAFGVEGNGGDIVRYHIPMNGFDGLIQVSARVYYQPVPPAWNEEMFSMQGPRIDSFRTLYDAADGTPTLVAVDTLLDDRTGIADRLEDIAAVWPNPTSDGVVTISAKDVTLMAVYDATGREVRAQVERTAQGLRITLPATPGTYQIAWRAAGRARLSKVLRW